MTETADQITNRRVVHLAGEIDLEHAPQVRKVLLGAVEQGRLILVDMAGVEYIDSSGIACLIEALQEARKKCADLALIAVNPQAMRVLALARLDTVFAIHDDLTSAVQAKA
jgi:anti-sigma B factor antagonist